MLKNKMYKKLNMKGKESMKKKHWMKEEEEVIPEEPETEDIHKQIFTDYPLLCRLVRIGAYKVYPVRTCHHVQVSLSMDSISFQAPVLTEPNKFIFITIRNHDITRVLVHFGRCLPVMYVYTTAAFGEAVRNALHMSQADHRYFDPMSKDDKTQKLAFLIVSMTEEQKTFIRQCFLGDKKVNEIDQKQANEILLKSTPAQMKCKLFTTIDVLKSRPLLGKIIEETELLKEKPFLKEELAGILVHELVFGKGLPRESHPITVVMKYKDAIDKAYQNAKKDDSLAFKGLLCLPHYARVNTFLTTVSDVIKNLKETEYEQIYYGEEISENEYLELVLNLKAGKFVIDYHFKDLLVSAGDEDLTTCSLIKKNHMYLQNKSSCLPVSSLGPKPGSNVVDTGVTSQMKIIHIAASMKNKGKIYAHRKDNNILKIRKKMLDPMSIEICEADCEDFYLVNKYDPKFRDLKYIILDPSCFGSGMVSRMDTIRTSVTNIIDAPDMHAQKVPGFRILLLKHALSFPSVKRVVYSTCSITEEENEYVIQEVLSDFKFNFKLVSVLPDWPVRGSDSYEYGNLCLRAYPDKTLTNGFFVAMFERIDYEEQKKICFVANEESVSNGETFSEKRRKEKSKVKQENRKTELPCNSSGNSTKVSTLEENAHSRNGDSLTNSHILSEKKKAKHNTNEAVDFQEIPFCSNNIESDIDGNDKFKECTSIIGGDVGEEGSCSENNFGQRETSNIKRKKKKHKRMHCDETEQFSDNPDSVFGTFYLDYKPTTETKDNFDQRELANIKTKKKKHKQKYSEKTSDNFKPITKICSPDCGPAVESQDIFVPEKSTDFKRKKKKHKPKHFEETKRASSNVEYVVEAYPGSELITESPNSSSRKKKHKKKRRNNLFRLD